MCRRNHVLKLSHRRVLRKTQGVESCLCQYVKNPNLQKLVNSPNAKKQENEVDEQEVDEEALKSSRASAQEHARRSTTSIDSKISKNPAAAPTTMLDSNPTNRHPMKVKSTPGEDPYAQKNQALYYHQPGDQNTSKLFGNMPLLQPGDQKYAQYSKIIRQPAAITTNQVIKSTPTAKLHLQSFTYKASVQGIQIPHPNNRQFGPYMDSI
ncbi:hypothetical protein ACFX2C_017951 [Malus domestica]